MLQIMVLLLREKIETSQSQDRANRLHCNIMLIATFYAPFDKLATITNNNNHEGKHQNTVIYYIFFVFFNQIEKSRP